MSLYFNNKSVELLVKRHGTYLTIERKVSVEEAYSSPSGQLPSLVLDMVQDLYAPLPEYNAVTGRVVAKVTQTFLVKGFISVSRPDEIHFTSVPMGDRRVFLLPYDQDKRPYTLQTGDVIIDPVTSKRLSVNRVQDYRSNGTLLMLQALLDE